MRVPPALADALREGESARWSGTVEVEPRERRALMVTDTRLVLEDAQQVGGWVGMDVVDVAEHGVLLPYSSVLNVVAPSSSGTVRWSLRAVDPPSFDGIEWPAAAQPLIERQLAEAAESRARMRQQLGRIVAVTIAGLGLLLVVLAIALLAT